MRLVPDSIIVALLAVIAAGAAHAQAARPASAPASAPEPMTAASKAIPARNPAVTAAENAKEPGAQRPEERVIPQISVPLKSRNIALPVATAASASAKPGAIDDSAARCMAASNAKERAACEPGAKASEASKAVR